MSRSPVFRLKKRQQGSALLLILLLAMTLGLAFLFRPDDSASLLATREQHTGSTLAQAKEALIGKSVIDPSGGAYGLLQLPDLGSSRNTTPNEGVAAGNFTGNATNLSVIGRLPWRTLGLAPLRDANGECLWYAVSGAGQSDLPPATFNWDTLGHFELFRSDGTSAGTLSASGTNYHERPLAIVFSAGPPLEGQDRQASTTDTVIECGGNYDARNYLDSFAANANINSIVNYFPASTNNATGDASTLAAPKPIITNDVDVASGGGKIRIANDRLLPITTKEIFDRVKKRSEFKVDIDTLLDRLQACLNTTAPISASANNKGIDINFRNTCRPTLPSALQTFFDNWEDNLLYAGGTSGNFAINNTATGCKGILVFAGERTLRTVPPLLAQTRATASQKGDASTPGDYAMYLEGTNATLFPGNGTYTGAGFYSASSSSSDIVRCIRGTAGATQTSFPTGLPTATPIGPGNHAAVNVNTSEQTVTIIDASGIGSGCLWFPTAIPLTGKTLRAYYQYQFVNPDTYATTGATADRGNGFTFQFVRGDIPDAFGTFVSPNTCGTESNLGALGTSDIWGSLSYIIETDIRRNSAQSDPAGNHTAIMTNGSLSHSGLVPTTACNGTSNGCLHTPENKFEESPTPLLHNQRIEIHTGCSASCDQCNPASTGSNAKISVWVDCADCSDVTSDQVDVESIVKAENRDFSGTVDWTGGNWSVSANTLAHTAGANPVTLPNAALTSAPASGKSYRIDIVINTVTPGAISVGIGGNTTTPLTQAAGASTSYKLQIDAINANPLTLTPDATWTGNISQISLRAIRTPTIARCVPLHPEMSQVFFGLTGGFLSTADTLQGVIFRNLFLRSE